MKSTKLNIILILIFVLSFGCKKTEKEAPKKEVPKIVLRNSRVEFRLPFEVANQGDEINFKLFTEQGKICEAEFDTVTKTGGDVIYNLPNGKFKYTFKTILNETLNKEITIVSDTTFLFYEDCYKMVPVIKQEELELSKHFKIVILYAYGNHKNELEVKKQEKQYWLSIKNKNKWRKSKPIDSIKFIKNISEFESVIVGNREVENYDKDLKNDYMNSSKVYIKSDSLLVEVVGVKDVILKRAYKKLIDNLVVE